MPAMVYHHYMIEFSYFFFIFLILRTSVMRDRDSKDILLEKETIELCNQPHSRGEIH